MLAGASDSGICLFDFEYRRSIDKIRNRIETKKGCLFLEGEHQLFNDLKKQVKEYFTGTRKVFDLPLDLVGSAFQVRVWQELQRIPYGTTRSYEQQAINLGNPLAIRAVAGANGENGIAIIIPCHRVIGKNGSLTGYGGGLHKKKWLLEHERKFAGLTNQQSLF